MNSRNSNQQRSAFVLTEEALVAFTAINARSTFDSAPSCSPSVKLHLFEYSHVSKLDRIG